MKPVFLQAGSVLISLFTSIHLCEARPGNHKHHHNQRLPREISAVGASSGGGSADVSYKDHCDPNNIPALDEKPYSNAPNATSEDADENVGPKTVDNEEPSELKVRVVPYYAWYSSHHSEGKSVEGDALSSSASKISTSFTTSTTDAKKAASSSSGDGTSVNAAFTLDAIAVSSSTVSKSSTNIFNGGYQSFVLSFANPTSTTGLSALSTQVKLQADTTSEVSSSSTPTPSSICPTGNGTTYTSVDENKYQVVCDVDYTDDIYPFRLVDSFDGCLAACDGFNVANTGIRCLAAVFVPSRINDADDCYLKPSVDHPSTATVSIEGAILITPTASAAMKSKTSQHTTSTKITSNSSSKTSVAVAPSISTSGSEPGITYASKKKVIGPKVSATHLHGPTVNQPTNQFINISEPHVGDLASDLLVQGVNTDLSTRYPMSPNTGVLQVNISTQPYIDSLSNTPHISRDGGRGGYLNGQHLFIFCDTGSYSTTTATKNGDFLGFVSSSVAVDAGMNALSGDPISLKDGVGQWSDDTGRMRGLAPLTVGELEYNLAMQGNGQRYAVWPESSIIPLDATTALVYAPVIYDEVNMDTKEAKFTYTGAALLEITAGGNSGPIAKRVKDILFERDEVEWGCAGGIRSWGPSGIGGDDGSVYVFGAVSDGVLLARTVPNSTTNRDSYEYWNGKTWTTSVLESSSKAFFIDGPFMDIDVFYSPRHLTFIAVYLTIYADSTFYYRYLKAPEAILPPYHAGGDPSDDYVESLLKYDWSDEEVLYKASPGLSGKYIYSGGVHAGYFGSSDVINGGPKMLLSWTAPTGKDPSTLISEYQIITAEVDWI